ncbi:hypothetical protein DERP_004997 [Dermatophagoides pteronyssinus]|uniref:Uncharacterized protein n=1 Tax=Dermatophagoides pteronyssinus TaxID=6956 RepID=A0ABQ8JT46_DERPT|nr:hypothetical protein DERP_004997 [Dermatophagoides pteronyssinus]
MDRNNRKSVTGIGIYGIETPAGRYQISNLILTLGIKMDIFP